MPLESIKDNPATRYSPLHDMYTLDLLNDFSLHIQLHAFGPASLLHERIRTESHVAFKTDDIKAALKGKEVLMPLYEPFAGYRCAMVLVNGQLIELIETTLTEAEIWGGAKFKNSALYPGRIS